MTFINKLFYTFCFLGCVTFNCVSQNIESVKSNFKNPTQEFKPKTWFHVMSGNMSEEGLTKDLEAIQRVGIGGILMFNVTHSIPNGRVKFNSDEHQRLITHAAKECERLGLSFGVHNCDGWTSSGGPWVTPENSMKQIVWTETIVNGGKLNVHLNRPTAREGFYREVAVVAYPTLDKELKDSELKPVITSSDPNLDTQIISDGRWDETSRLSSSESRKNWVQFDFGKVVPIVSIYMPLMKTISGSRKSQLLVSEDGITYSLAKNFDLKRLGKKEFAIDETFDPIKSRYFRLEIEDDYDIMELDISVMPRYANFLAKTSLFKKEDHTLDAITNIDPSDIVKLKDIKVLSEDLDEKGNLKTSLPEGRWTIMRIGYTITGAVNSPASEEGRGLEIDKMSKKALDVHYDAYVGKVVDNTKTIAPNALQYLEIDSFEVGGQNWTENYEELFRQFYGYSIEQFLPLYAGKVIESSEISDEVLWDIRSFNSKLITENYFDYFTELTNKDGLISYIEPYSFNAPFNELDAAKKTDIPMGEFWMHQRFQIGTAASSAHIYGKKVVSAESFSAQPEINWRGYPGASKVTGDKAWILGVNEFMFHRYAHQPNTHVEPGMTMSQWGSHIDRTQTWWNNAGKAWFEYIARGSYLLRQGNPVSDALVFVGEGSPNSVTGRKLEALSLQQNTNYDNVNADVINNRIKIRDSFAVLPEGTAYRMLILENCEVLNLETLAKLDEFSQKGLLIIGKKPKKVAGYGHTEAERRKFNELVDDIWSRPTTIESIDLSSLYKSKNWNYDIEFNDSRPENFIHRATKDLDIYFFVNTDSVPINFKYTYRITGKVPEFWQADDGKQIKAADYQDNGRTTTVNKYLEPGESVFVVFKSEDESHTPIERFNSLTFRNPEFSFSENDELMMQVSNMGEVNLSLKNDETIEYNVDEIPEDIHLIDNWNIDFNKEKSKITNIKTDTLFDWINSSEFDIKHYSGSASYKTKFSLNSEYLKKDVKLVLNLGKVEIAAEIYLNNQYVKTAWFAPYTVDITEYVKKGLNELEILVTNTWTNRLIGDEQLPDHDNYSMRGTEGEEHVMPDWYLNNQPMPSGPRQTFTTYPFYDKDSVLMSSGLIGPVILKANKLIVLGED